MRPPDEKESEASGCLVVSLPGKMHKSPLSIFVVVPTYNNEITIGNVIKDILKITPELILINDGSTDGTNNVLSAIQNITVITHEVNLWKGVALINALNFAAQSGYDYAISMDGDGQHLAADLPKFIETIKNYPEALVIGRRYLAGGGKKLKSLVLRAHSNFWVWVLTQRWLGDTQCGFRAYPLRSILNLLLTKQKYDFEIEVLVKALWIGIPVQEVSVEVNYVTGSRSHFRPFRDFMLVSALIFSLLLKKLFLPGPLLKLKSLREYQDGIKNRRFQSLIMDTLAHECSNPRKFAFSVGVGVFFGIAPLWGFQMMSAVLAAHKLRLSKSISLICSNISFPAAIPLIIYGSLLVGRWTLTGAIDYSLKLDRTILEVAAKTYATEYLVGSVILAAVAGAVSALLAYATVHLFRRLWRTPT